MAGAPGSLYALIHAFIMIAIQLLLCALAIATFLGIDAAIRHTYVGDVLRRLALWGVVVLISIAILAVISSIAAPVLVPSLALISLFIALSVEFGMRLVPASRSFAIGLAGIAAGVMGAIIGKSIIAFLLMAFYAIVGTAFVLAVEPMIRPANRNL